MSPDQLVHNKRLVCHYSDCTTMSIEGSLLTLKHSPKRLKDQRPIAIDVYGVTDPADIEYLGLRFALHPIQNFGVHYF